MREGIINITQEQLLDLLCTATYGSGWLDCHVSDEARAKVKIAEEDCSEDVWAKALLAGQQIEAIDYYAEGTKYGPHESYIDDEGNTHYPLSLEDVQTGLQSALDGTYRVMYGKHERMWLHRCVEELLSDELGDLDQTDCEALMQVIMFDEVIYG